MPVPGDYDGDGITDIAIYRPPTAAWHTLLSTSNFQTGAAVLQWGQGADIPVLKP